MFPDDDVFLLPRWRVVCADCLPDGLRVWHFLLALFAADDFSGHAAPGPCPAVVPCRVCLHAVALHPLRWPLGQWGRVGAVSCILRGAAGDPDSVSHVWSLLVCQHIALLSLLLQDVQVHLALLSLLLQDVQVQPRAAGCPALSLPSGYLLCGKMCVFFPRVSGGGHRHS